MRALIHRIAHNTARRVSQADRIEDAFRTGAALVDGPLLTSCLGRFVDAILPAALEERAFTMVGKHGGGWRITEGELHEQGWDSSDPLPAQEDPTGRGSSSATTPGPRCIRQRRHDALRAALRQRCCA